jgi:hypothetical protein
MEVANFEVAVTQRPRSHVPSMCPDSAGWGGITRDGLEPEGPAFLCNLGTILGKYVSRRKIVKTPYEDSSPFSRSSGVRPQPIEG